MLGEVVNFGRYAAHYPSFALQPSIHRDTYSDSFHRHRHQRNDSLIEVVSPDRIPGETLPRADATWFALAPFQDMNKKSLSRDGKTKLIRARRAFVELLAQLAESPQFRWRATEMHCGEAIGLDRFGNANKAFWIDLLRSLSPSAASDDRLPLERGLIALSRERRPRFLVCFDHAVSASGLPRLLELFLLPRNEHAEPVQFGKIITDVLGDEDTSKRIEVEIGLSFTVGQIPWAVLAPILAIADRLHTNRDAGGVHFHITALRFGLNCQLDAKTLERLGERFPASIQNLRLGKLRDVSEQSTRALFVGLARRGLSLRRLRLDSLGGFNALAAALRDGSLSHLRELDVIASSGLEHAAWLAFALFHVDSKSSVTSLCVRSPRNGGIAQLTDEWLETFVRVLQSATAALDLANVEEEEDDDDSDQGSTRRSQLVTFVRVRPGSVARVASTKSSKKLCTLDSPDLEEFESVVEQRQSLAIVIPGVGIGWVPLSSITSKRTQQSHLTRTRNEIPINRRITSFAWDRPASDVRFHETGRVMKLLSIIGGPLRCLQLPAFQLRSKYLAEILRVCPNLVELNISGHTLEDIQPLVDAYASGQCRIATLSIARMELHKTSSGDITVAMATILQGAGGHVLRQLVVHALPEVGYTTERWNSLETSHVWSHGIVPLARAVSASPGFEYLQLLGFDLFGHTARQRLPLSFTAQPTSSPPMTLAAKLAFLSVVYQRDRSKSSSSQLDARVLSIVFRFGSDNVVRRVLAKGRMWLDL